MKINTKKGSFRFNQGFTLIEAMVTISVLAILTSIATPSMRAFVESSRISTVTNEVAADLFFIRSEALKRRMNVYICPQKEGASPASCETTTSDANYANGWLMYADCNSNGEYDNTMTCDSNGDGTDDSFELLKVHDSLVGNTVIKTSNGTFETQVGYGMSGRSTGAGNFCISIASKRSKEIVIAATGRVRIADIDNCD